MRATPRRTRAGSAPSATTTARPRGPHVDAPPRDSWAAGIVSGTVVEAPGASGVGSSTVRTVVPTGPCGSASRQRSSEVRLMNPRRLSMLTSTRGVVITAEPVLRSVTVTVRSVFRPRTAGVSESTATTTGRPASGSSSTAPGPGAPATAGPTAGTAPAAAVGSRRAEVSAPASSSRLARTEVRRVGVEVLRRG